MALVLPTLAHAMHYSILSEAELYIALACTFNAQVARDTLDYIVQRAGCRFFYPVPGLLSWAHEVRMVHIPATGSVMLIWHDQRILLR